MISSILAFSSRSAACMGYLVFGEVPVPAILVGAAVLLFGVAIGTKQGRCRVLQIYLRARRERVGLQPYYTVYLVKVATAFF